MEEDYEKAEVGRRERLGKIAVPQVKESMSAEGAQVTVVNATQRLPFEGLHCILWT